MAPPVFPHLPGTDHTARWLLRYRPDRVYPLGDEDYARRWEALLGRHLDELPPPAQTRQARLLRPRRTLLGTEWWAAWLGIMLALGLPGLWPEPGRGPLPPLLTLLLLLTLAVTLARLMDALVHDWRRVRLDRVLTSPPKETP